MKRSIDLARDALPLIKVEMTFSEIRSPKGRVCVRDRFGSEGSTPFDSFFRE